MGTVALPPTTAEAEESHFSSAFYREWNQAFLGPERRGEGYESRKPQGQEAGVWDIRK